MTAKLPYTLLIPLILAAVALIQPQPVDDVCQVCSCVLTPVPTCTPTPTTLVLPTNTPTTTPIPTPTPEPLPIISIIKGVAGIGNCDHIGGVNAEAWYGWVPERPACDGADFYPMVRDADQWAQLISGTMQIADHAEPVIFGPNEPDLCPYQACLTPQEAVPLWRWIEDTYGADYALVAPVPSPNDVNWLYNFRRAYIAEYGEPPRFDYLAAHAYFHSEGRGYGGIEQTKYQVGRFITWADAWDVSGGVIVTEWAAFAVDWSFGQNFDYDTAIALADEFMAWMQTKPEIKGCFWFSACDWSGVWPSYATTALYNCEDDSLTLLGEWWRDQ